MSGFDLDEITIDIVEAEGAVAMISIDLPLGTARLLGELRFVANVLYVDRMHVEGLSPGALGRAGLNAILEKMLMVADVERIVIQGAARTTGKYAGKVPRPVVFPH